jgi:hypothetical protein
VKRCLWLAGLATAILCLGLSAVPAQASRARVHAVRVPVVMTPRAPIGATTIGRITPTSPGCGVAYVWFQTFMDPVNPPYTVPYAGVVTSFSYNANATPGQVAALFFTPSGTDFIYDLAHNSSPQTVRPGSLNTFPMRIPVAAGEILALRTFQPNMTCVAAGGTIDQIGGNTFSDAQTTLDVRGISLLHQYVDISAVVEPDQDGDGYGDVSQDGCPQLASVHVPCPAPVVTVTKGPARKTTQHKAKIRFTSNAAGSTFLCSVDGRAFKTCLSPFKATFLLGTHTVRIQATSPLGVVGPPVTVLFKVKPKR